jgi:ribonuclease T1
MREDSSSCSFSPSSTARYGKALFLLLALILSVLVAFGTGVPSGESSVQAGTAAASSGLPAVAPKAGVNEIDVRNLPLEAQRLLLLIKKGGPFSYAQDGTVFSNREGILPAKYQGYYHEYTVPTPGAKDRGARRIIAGKDGEYYYTNDHYRSFKRIREQ